MEFVLKLIAYNLFKKPRVGFETDFKELFSEIESKIPICPCLLMANHVPRSAAFSSRPKNGYLNLKYKFFIKPAKIPSSQCKLDVKRS